MIAPPGRHKDFQVRRSSPVTNLFSLAFILGDSAKVQTLSTGGPCFFFLSVKPEKCGKEVEGESRSPKEAIQFPLTLLI